MQNKLAAWNENEFSPRLHLIKGENLYLIFDINSLSLFKVNSFTCEIFSQILNGRSINDLIKEYEIDDARNIYKILFQNDCRTKAIASNKTAGRPVLDRLVLNISNDCNLSCKYCYAMHGTYGNDKSFMEDGLALKTVDYFYKIYDEMNNIQFFGGEPLLNPHTIEIICAYITEKHVQGKIKLRAARSIPRPLGRGGRTQFDLFPCRKLWVLRDRGSKNEIYNFIFLCFRR